MDLEEIDFGVFKWLDYKNLVDSDGYKLEIHSQKDLNIDEFIVLFYVLFSNYLDDLVIGQFGEDSEWRDFCLDTWDIDKDRYDYNPSNKSEYTKNYLTMLLQNNIPVDYTGHCKCHNWNMFLSVVINCVFNNIAPYSVLIYAPSYDFVFYFHHSKSIGLYYKNLNEELIDIIEKAKLENMTIENFSDQRLAKFNV